MALLKNSDPKNVSGAYERLFGNAELGLITSKIQSAVIASGTELEQIIVNMVQPIEDLDEFLKREIMPEGVWLGRKQQMKKSKILDFSDSEPDFIIFKRRTNKQDCHVVELKDGHVFDTKKASAERQAVHGFIERNAQYIQYRVSAHFCAFNQNNKTVIWEGFKKRIAPEEAMTGREFCELLEINYDAIIEQRKADGPNNIEFLLSELIKIAEIRDRLTQMLSG